MTSQAQKENYDKIKETAMGIHILPWHYVGGQTYGANGSAVVNIIPDATIMVVKARGGPVNYEINGAVADAFSHGYVPEDQGEIIGPLDNLGTLAIFGGDAATYAHITFYREN